jgi:hypothetical protein
MIEKIKETPNVGIPVFHVLQASRAQPVWDKQKK